MSKTLNPDSTQLLTHPSHHTSALLHNHSISFAPHAPQHPTHKKQPRVCQVPCHPSPTFTPEIHELPYELYPQKWQNMQKSRTEQWEGLTTDNRERDMERAELKAKEQERELYACTFSPFSASLSEKEQLFSSDQGIHEKLYEEAAQRRLRLLEL